MRFQSLSELKIEPALHMARTHTKFSFLELSHFANSKIKLATKHNFINEE